MKLIKILFIAVLFISMSACSSTTNDVGGNTSVSSAIEQRSQDTDESDTDHDNKMQTEPSAVETEPDNTSKTLVVYFSCTGTTKSVAEHVADETGADIYRIEPEVPYTTADLNYSDNTSRSSLEMNDDSSRPAITGNVENLEEYSTVFLGYPIWWGQAPRILGTFMESNDFSGKTIVPFCTSGSSGVGSSDTNLHAFTGDNTVWISGTRFSSGASRETVVEWINGLGLEIAAE